MSEDLFKNECYLIQGAIFEVYKTLGCGFLESVYQESLEIEFDQRKIPFSAQQEISLHYKNIPLKQIYKPDFICFNNIVVELKAATILDSVHDAQVFNYLKATELRLGLFVNFGYYPGVEIKRIIL